MPPQDKRGRHPSMKKVDKTPIVDHITSFSPTISHYRRAHAPNRLYLPSDVTMKLMHDDFKESFPHLSDKVSYELYRQQVAKLNISFMKLGHEECFDCAAFKEHCSSDQGHSKTQLADGCEPCKEWSDHHERYKKTRIHYQTDVIKECSPAELIVSADLQKLVGFCGRCPFRMYIPSKPNKYGMKIIMMCDNSTKCMVNASPYLGKGSNPTTHGCSKGTFATFVPRRNIFGPKFLNLKFNIFDFHKRFDLLLGMDKLKILKASIDLNAHVLKTPNVKIPLSYLASPLPSTNTIKARTIQQIKRENRKSEKQRRHPALHKNRNGILPIKTILGTERFIGILAEGTLEGILFQITVVVPITTGDHIEDSRISLAAAASDTEAAEIEDFTPLTGTGTTLTTHILHSKPKIKHIKWSQYQFLPVHPNHNRIQPHFPLGS
ncbi:unnamed protein product [Nesidiocoris tenuis]|uniref:PiggyBac transposable element-derived protein domain-containing protein n=1 Tax=Nesidiocoris tenuis TaxID=355587 RepID=A0A6H5H4E3_9HEMI|nr:unnamed protein product [Nesidiocoris tenuis]